MAANPKTPSKRPKNVASKPDQGASRSGGVKRLYRLLRLIYLMQREALDAKTLMAHVGVSRATFFRCLDQLTQAGIPHYYDPDAHGYRIRGDWFLPPLQFTFDEVLAVLSLAPSGRHAHPALEAVHSGLLKMVNALPTSLREEIRPLLPHVQHHGTPQSLPCDRDYYGLVVNAFRHRRVVKARYYSVREDVEFDTVLRIHAVFFHRHSWYLMAYSDRDRGTRTFKLSRFLDMAVTRQRYTIPAHFALSQVLSGSWGIITDGPGYDVSIRFHGRGAHYVRETLWHPKQKITDLPNRECRLEVFVNGFDELVPWILSWGPLAKVEAPEELRQAVRKEIEAMLAAQNT